MIKFTINMKENMSKKSKFVSFYPNEEKNQEFLKRLKDIVSKEDSSIAECSIQKSVSNNFCVFIIPKTPKYDFSIIIFNFAHRFDRESKNFYDYYEKEGLSKKDIKELNKLFAEYTFENYYEGLFFASKFFNKKDSPINLYLKFTENEKNNKHVIEGKKVAKYYSIMFKKEIERLLEKKEINQNSSLIECNTYGLESSKNIKDVLKLINEKNNQHSDKLLIIEHVQDYETMKRFVMNVFTVVEDNLIKQEIKDFIK